ncbi:DUF4190 domain-containing protein [Streptomyces sp. H-KF8]|uniref:DUF4190 domain-containing protein n=1 Tax=Streptomyces sp. H-KF8 TaxID=1727216 RepID=UPI000AB0385A|nr:DUF4190 domain-containing protein [Streptomyces sp. H-KF8]
MSIPPPAGPRQPEGAQGQHPQGRYPASPPQGAYPPPRFPQGPHGVHGPYGPYVPYGFRPPPPTNGLAIASLVFGLLWIVPFLGLVLGLVALRQIRRRGEQGRGMAIGGAVMSAAGIVAWVGMVLSGAAADFWDDLRVTRGNEISTLEKGECFDSPGGLVGRASVAERVPCAGEHDGEVFGVVLLSDGAYPGAESLSDTADDRCYALQDVYAMDGWALPADVDVYHLTPSGESWRSGDRVITCVFGNRDENAALTGSLRRDETTLDAHQVVYLESTHVIDAALGKAPEADHVQDDLPGHRAWAREVSEALAEQSGMLREHEWPAGAEKPVKDLVNDLEKAGAAWAKAAGTGDPDTFLEHHDRGWDLVDPYRSVAARAALGLAVTPPVLGEDEKEWEVEGEDGTGGGDGADEDRIEV